MIKYHFALDYEIMSLFFNELIAGNQDSINLLRSHDVDLRQIAIDDFEYAIKKERSSPIILEVGKRFGLFQKFVGMLNKQSLFSIGERVKPTSSINASYTIFNREIVLPEGQSYFVYDVLNGFLKLRSDGGLITNWITQSEFILADDEKIEGRMELGALIKKYGHKFNNISLAEYEFVKDQVVYDIYTLGAYIIVEEIPSKESVVAKPYVVDNGYANSAPSLFNKNRFRPTRNGVSTTDSETNAVVCYSSVRVIEKDIDNIMTMNGYTKPSASNQDELTLYSFYRRLLGKGPLIVSEINDNGMTLTVTFGCAQDLKEFSKIANTILFVPSYSVVLLSDKEAEMTMSKKEKRLLKQQEEDREKQKAEELRLKEEKDDIAGGPYDITKYQNKIVRMNTAVGEFDDGAFGIVTKIDTKLGRITLQLSQARKSTKELYFRVLTGQHLWFDVYSDLIVTDEEEVVEYAKIKK